MRVKLCPRCPYTPRDLADHYDPEGLLHVCAKCDGQEASANRYPRRDHRRHQCATVPNTAGYVDFKLPDNVSGETTGVFFRSSGFRSRELTQ